MCDDCGCSAPEVYAPPEVYTPPEDYTPPVEYTDPQVYAPPVVPLSTDVNPVDGSVGYDAGMAQLEWLVAHPQPDQDPSTVPDPTMMGGYGQFGNAVDGAVGGVPGHDVPGTPDYTQT